MTNKKDNGSTLCVTMALPYANGDIHLGHLVEAVQTDIYVRYKKMTQRKTIFVCADDTHGTPIELNALKLGITPEELIKKAWENHVRDYAGFDICFDIFSSTNSEKNREWAEFVYNKLKEKNLVVEREIEQFYCDHDKRFLPDRFIKGACPKCGKEDQYGDICESCGFTYEPTDLTKPICAICGNQPMLKKSSHYFVTLDKEECFLREYLNTKGILQDDMRNFIMTWIDGGLREWCISRDAPYFGFKIPETDDKYFYVWLDAPIGYISSTDEWCSNNSENVGTIWKSNSSGEVVHMIGKDIVSFHTLFWPVMLKASGLKLPSKYFVHGFLTVEGEKMSKSRGTFILARDFLDKVDHPNATEFLRFYYGSKLSNNSADIDLNINELCSKANTTIVNNIGNFLNRTVVFLERFFAATVPDVDWDLDIANIVESIGADIAHHYEQAQFKHVVEKIHVLGNIANKYYQDSKPWVLIKNDKKEAAKVMNTCVNLAKALIVFLKPIVPNIVAPVERQFGCSFNWNDYNFSLRGEILSKGNKLAIPIDPSVFDSLLGTVKVAKNEDDNLIDIDTFSKIELKIGEIKEAEKVTGSNKLLCLKVDDGNRIRQIIGGLGKAYTAEELVGKKVTFVANLKPVKLMGMLSEGMLLAASKGKKMFLVTPESDIVSGATVK